MLSLVALAHGKRSVILGRAWPRLGLSHAIMRPTSAVHTQYQYRGISRSSNHNSIIRSDNFNVIRDYEYTRQRVKSFLDRSDMSTHQLDAQLKQLTARQSQKHVEGHEMMQLDTKDLTSHTIARNSKKKGSLNHLQMMTENNDLAEVQMSCLKSLSHLLLTPKGADVSVIIQFLRSSHMLSFPGAASTLTRDSAVVTQGPVGHSSIYDKRKLLTRALLILVDDAVASRQPDAALDLYLSIRQLSTEASEVATASVVSAPQVSTSPPVCLDAAGSERLLRCLVRAGRIDGLKRVLSEYPYVDGSNPAALSADIVTLVCEPLVMSGHLHFFVEGPLRSYLMPAARSGSNNGSVGPSSLEASRVLRVLLYARLRRHMGRAEPSAQEKLGLKLLFSTLEAYHANLTGLSVGEEKVSTQSHAEQPFALGLAVGAGSIDRSVAAGKANSGASALEVLETSEAAAAALSWFLTPGDGDSENDSLEPSGGSGSLETHPLWQLEWSPYLPSAFTARQLYEMERYVAYRAAALRENGTDAAIVSNSDTSIPPAISAESAFYLRVSPRFELTGNNAANAGASGGLRSEGSEQQFAFLQEDAQVPQVDLTVLTGDLTAQLRKRSNGTELPPLLLFHEQLFPTALEAERAALSRRWSARHLHRGLVGFLEHSRTELEVMSDWNVGLSAPWERQGPESLSEFDAGGTDDSDDEEDDSDDEEDDIVNMLLSEESEEDDSEEEEDDGDQRRVRPVSHAASPTRSTPVRSSRREETDSDHARVSFEFTTVPDALNPMSDLTNIGIATIEVTADRQGNLDLRWESRVPQPDAADQRAMWDVERAMPLPLLPAWDPKSTEIARASHYQERLHTPRPLPAYVTVAQPTSYSSARRADMLDIVAQMDALGYNHYPGLDRHAAPASDAEQQEAVPAAVEPAIAAQTAPLFPNMNQLATDFEHWNRDL